MDSGNRLPTLYIFSGLPGAGKSTLAQQLAKRLGAFYLRIDTIEQTLRDLCTIEVQSEGYSLSYSIARDNLLLGLSVVADSCNPIPWTRDRWEQVALETNAAFVNIEVVCSDKSKHRARVEIRPPTVAGLKLPTWEEVEAREYHAWTKNRIIIDTADKSEEECIKELLSKLPALTSGRS